MKVVDVKSGVKMLEFESGLQAYVSEDGRVSVNGTLIESTEFADIASIRHIMKTK